MIEMKKSQEKERKHFKCIYAEVMITYIQENMSWT